MDIVTLGAALSGSKKYTDQVEQSLENNLSLKANTSDVNTATANLQTQIDQIAQAAGSGTADTEVAQARIGADGTSYQTLKARLDGENSELKEDLTEIQDAFEYKNPVNWLDWENVKHGVQVYTSTGEEHSNSLMVSTDFIPVNVGDTLVYYGSNLQPRTDSNWIFYDAEKRYLSGINAGQSSVTANSKGYVRVSRNENASGSTQMICKNGYIPTEWSAYFKPYQLTVNESIEKYYKNGYNLFDGTYQKDTYIGSDGIFRTQSGARTTNRISCVAGEVYCINGGNRARWRFVNDSETMTGYANSEIVVAPINTTGMYVYYGINPDDRIAITHSSKFKEFVPEKVLDESKVGIENKNKALTFSIDDCISGRYEADIDFVEPSANMTYEQLYAMYDELVSDYPNYVSRSLIGTQIGGEPIYAYSFNAGKVKYGDQQRILPKIIVTHTHSFEKPAVVGGSQFWQDLCKNWRTNEILRTLRWNVNFIVIPCCNPYGFTNNQRKNENGVDLARNYSAGWNTEGHNGDPSSVYYAGTAPLSENETIAINAFMEQNKDAIFAIDMHNYTTFSASNSLLWCGSDITRTQRILSGYVQKMSAVCIAEYMPDDENNISYGIVEREVDGGSATKQWESKGVDSTILELVTSFGTTPNDVQKWSCEALGNLILLALKNLLN